MSPWPGVPLHATTRLEWWRKQGGHDRSWKIEQPYGGYMIKCELKALGNRDPVRATGGNLQDAVANALEAWGDTPAPARNLTYSSDEVALLSWTEIGRYLDVLAKRNGEPTAQEVNIGGVRLVIVRHGDFQRWRLQQAQIEAALRQMEEEQP